MAQEHHGSCLCHAVQYTITGEPFTFKVCYCSNCRKASGSAFMTNIFFKNEQVKITKGGEHVKVYRDTETKSGDALLRSFCPTCGSSLFLGSGNRNFTIVSAGTIEEGFDWVPRGESFPECKSHWVDVKTRPKTKSKL